MKKYILVFVVSCIIMGLCSGCQAPHWFLINSQGIATYNRHTGQFEIMWDNRVPETVAKIDSAKVLDNDVSCPPNGN